MKSQWSGKTKFERLLFSSSSLSVLKAVIFLRPIVVPCPRHTIKLFCQVVYYVGALAMAQMVEYCLLVVHCHHSLFFFNNYMIWMLAWEMHICKSLICRIQIRITLSCLVIVKVFKT